MAVSLQPHHKARCLLRQSESGSAARAAIETSEGCVGIIIALNDQPLVPDQQIKQQQQQRLTELLNNLEALREEVSEESEETAGIAQLLSQYAAGVQAHDQAHDINRPVANTGKDRQ